MREADALHQHRPAPGAIYNRLSGRTTVPLFILVPQVSVKKRLDVDSAAQKWIRALPDLIIRQWGE